MLEEKLEERKTELWNLSIEDKLKKSEKIIEDAFRKYDKISIAFTGGKDSTLLLFLIKNFCEKNNIKIPKLMFIDEGDVFEEVIKFVNDLSKKWNLDITTVRNDDVLKQVNKIGDMIEINKLNETNRREIERLGYKGERFPFEPESFVGNHLMKTVALNNFIIKNDIDAVFTGIRWDEQEARSNETYFSKRKDPKHMRVHPLLHFRENDVWETIKKYNIPTNILYSKGYRSLGAKCTTTKSDNKPAWEQDLENTKERSGRRQDKEKLMKRLRSLGYM